MSQYGRGRSSGGVDEVEYDRDSVGGRRHQKTSVVRLRDGKSNMQQAP